MWIFLPHFHPLVHEQSLCVTKINLIKRQNPWKSFDHIMDFKNIFASIHRSFLQLFLCEQEHYIEPEKPSGNWAQHK